MVAALGLGAASAQGLGAAMARCDDGARWVELSNKISAYRLFASANRYIGPDEDKPVAALYRIAEMDPYSRMWTTEGVGWHLGTCWLREGKDHLFKADEVIPASAIPLLTGACLALAEAALAGVVNGDLTSMLAQFRERRHELCPDGFEDLALEALGLMAITLYPHVPRAIEDLLRESEDLAFFWHGVGRGLYFSPLGMLPVGAARRWLMKECQTLSRSDLGNENALSGFAWATTLVNMHSPEVLERCAEDLGAAASTAAFQNGVASAISFWLAAAPGQSLPDSIAGYYPKQPAAFDDAFATPARLANRQHPTEEKTQRLTKLFRYPGSNQAWDLSESG